MASGADTQTDTHTHIHTHTDARTKAISRNQARAAEGRAPGLITRTLIALMAEQPARKRGRPATRTQDWEMTNKRIHLLNITFKRWRALKDELKLPNDDFVASFLLSLYTELKSGNNNSGQQDEPVRRECDLSASIPLMEEEAGSRLPKIHAHSTLPKHGFDKAYDKSHTDIYPCSKSLLSCRGNFHAVAW